MNLRVWLKTVVILGLLATLALPTPVGFKKGVRVSSPFYRLPVWACYVAIGFFDMPGLQWKAFIVCIVHATFVAAVLFLLFKKK